MGRGEGGAEILSVPNLYYLHKKKFVGREGEPQYALAAVFSSYIPAHTH